MGVIRNKANYDTAYSLVAEIRKIRERKAEIRKKHRPTQFEMASFFNETIR